MPRFTNDPSFEVSAFERFAETQLRGQAKVAAGNRIPGVCK
jgi:hypothetical protein